MRSKQNRRAQIRRSVCEACLVSLELARLSLALLLAACSISDEAGESVIESPLWRTADDADELLKVADGKADGRPNGRADGVNRVSARKIRRNTGRDGLHVNSCDTNNVRSDWLSSR